MYILYGGKYTRSTGPQMVLEHANVPYELREIDIVAEEHRSSEFLSINPAGYVPAMITPEGDTLHEASAIMLYLADRHDLNDLVPEVNSPKRGVFYAKYFYLTNEIQPAMKRYYYPYRYSTDPADTDHIRDKAFEVALDRWGLIEQHLTVNGPCHMGDQLGLCDYLMAVWAAFGFDGGYSILNDHLAIRTCYEMVKSQPLNEPLLVEIESVRDEYLSAKSIQP